MPKNSMAGKHPSYLKLNWSPSSIARKKAYDTKYASTDKQKKYREALNCFENSFKIAMLNKSEIENVFESGKAIFFTYLNLNMYNNNKKLYI